MSVYDIWMASKAINEGRLNDALKIVSSIRREEEQKVERPRSLGRSRLAPRSGLARR
jgi:hypothetical protein